jgi:hypothetical protein
MPTVAHHSPNAARHRPDAPMLSQVTVSVRRESLQAYRHVTVLFWQLVAQRGAAGQRDSPL